MSRYDEGPVYYREIQKNGYLRRIAPDSHAGGKPGSKKPPLKPMWTVFCIHNGRTPYLEQYQSPASPAAHQPTWLSCLIDTKHVTAGLSHDFCLHTHNSLLTMRAEDWETMQDWVCTLRNKLTELRILSAAENVYCPGPQPPPAARAGTRDPCSPLPPTPAGPRVRVPGIEIPAPDPPLQAAQPEIEETSLESEPTWAETVQSLPSTSSKTSEPSVTKICGQNICLDDSILRRNGSDDGVDDEDDDSDCDYTQRVVVGRDGNCDEDGGEFSGTNVTVIKVSNKAPPHTAIPVVGDTDVFHFDFDRTVKDESNSFVNIVNTEVNIQNENSYGSVFDSSSNYGHISLTTSVNLNKDGVYERLCMASTSNGSNGDSNSLPNLEVKESPYECLFPFSDNAPVSNSNVTATTSSSIPNSNNSSASVSCNIPNSNSIQTSDCSSQIPINMIPNSNNSSTSVSCNIPNSNSIQTSNSSSQIARNMIPHSNSAQNSNCPVPNSNLNTTNTLSSHVTSSTPNSNVRNTNWNNSRTNSIQIVEDTSNGSNGDNVLMERFLRRNQSDNKNEQRATDQKPIWKRGLTELSIITKIRGIALNRNGRDAPAVSERSQQPKPVHRSRVDRVEGARRRSSSLSNGVPTHISLQSLRQRQAATLRAEQSTGASIVVRLPRNDLPVFAEASGCLWIAKWSRSGALCNGRTGDRVSAIRGVRPRDMKHALSLIKCTNTHMVDILFQRVPHGKIYVLNKATENDTIGIKLDNECQIVSVQPQSPAHNAGVPPGGQKWCLTEVNNRQINLVKGGDEEMTRLSSCGTEVSVLIQPAPLVKKLRAAIKSNRTLLNIKN